MRIPSHPIKIAFLDDDKDTLTYMVELSERYFEATTYQVEISMYTDAKSFLKTDKEYAIIFLDIEMPFMNGLHIAQEIRKVNVDCIICFISNHQKYALSSYHIHAFDYLVKPVQENNLFHLYDEIFHYKQTYLLKEKTLTFQTSTSTVSLSSSDILYVEYMETSLKYQNRSCVIHTNYEEIPIKTKINELYKSLPATYFAMPHKSFIVNFINIASIDKKDIIMCNGRKIPLSHKRNTSFKKAFQIYTSHFILMEYTEI